MVNVAVDGSWPRRAIESGLAVLIDRAVGEPPVRPHPVAALGTLLRRLEDRWWADSRPRGVLHATAGVGIGVAVGAVVPTTVVPTYVAVAGRALDEAAAQVESALLADDLDRARAHLPALVGRDPSDLSADEIARAVIESLAENTVDAVTSPALWGAMAGGAGALGYRAVNTLDAMVGHRTPRHESFGWASARTDDVANWVPARLTAAVVALVRPTHATTIAAVVRRDAAGHPSPNGGVVESAFAAALGLRLGGPSRYGDRDEVRPFLGDGRVPSPGDIAAARRLARDVDLATASLLIAAGAAAGLRRIGRATPDPTGRR